MSLLAELESFSNGRHFVGVFLDFLSDDELVPATGKMLWTAVNSTAPTVCNDAEGGTITMTSGATEYDGMQFQLGGAGANEWMRMRRKTEYWITGNFEVDDATQSDIFIGASIADTTILATATAHAITISDGIGLLKLDGATTWSLVVLMNSAGNTITMPFACDTARHTYSICVKPDGTDSLTGQIDVYLDGKLAYHAKNTEVTAIPHDEELAPSFAMRCGSAVARVVVMDFFGAGYRRLAS